MLNNSNELSNKLEKCGVKMKYTSVSISRLEQIIKNTVKTIDESKQQIYDIYEQAHTELLELKEDLHTINKRITETIQETEQLEILEKKSRRDLMEVSRNFCYYTEEDIEKAYDTAKNYQVQLALKREQEQQMIQKRKEIEKRLRHTQKILEMAQNLISHVAVAMDFLTGDLSSLGETMEDIHQKELMGIRIIRAQEEERQRIARDIHDGPAQSMSNIVLKAEICEKLIDLDMNKTKAELKELKELVRCSLREIRKIIFDLRPMSLDDLGLIPTIQRYLANYKTDTSIDMVFNYNDEIKESRGLVDVALFRIIQEALSNVKKYSKADRVIITINNDGETVTMKIKDNGVGFDVDRALKEIYLDDMRGFGLHSMKQRVELLNGFFNIKSIVDKGTEITVKIPINSRKGV